MKFRVELTARAQRDLAAIYEYIEADTSAHASRWFNELDRTLLNLERLPERGALVVKHGGTRQLLYRTKPHIYRILYAVKTRPGIVRVLHIRHGVRRSVQLGGHE